MGQLGLALVGRPGGGAILLKGSGENIQLHTPGSFSVLASAGLGAQPGWSAPREQPLSPVSHFAKQQAPLLCLDQFTELLGTEGDSKLCVCPTSRLCPLDVNRVPLPPSI